MTSRKQSISSNTNDIKQLQIIAQALQNAVSGKQDDITSGSLTIGQTSGLQNALDSKQNSITSNTNVQCNTLTASHLVYGSNDVATKITELETTKQDNIISTTNLGLNNITVNGIISYPNIPAFKAYYDTIVGTEITIEAGSLIPNNKTVYDTTNSYNKDEFQYIVPASGKYFFCCSFFSSDSLFIVDFRQNEVRVKRAEVKEAQLKFTTFNFNVTLDCLAGDAIDVRVNLGRIIVQYNAGPAPNGWHHFEGFKIS
jgi:hypothetical protein